LRYLLIIMVVVGVGGVSGIDGGKWGVLRCS
jgi:hypothetical protein